MNKASPKLFEAVAKGEHFKEVILTGRKAGGDQQEFLKITLNDALITSYQTGGSGVDDMPIDSFSINYSKIKFEYKQQKPDGTSDASVIGSWDLQKNQSF